jgi:hypothetical protein
VGQRAPKAPTHVLIKLSPSRLLALTTACREQIRSDTMMLFSNARGRWATPPSRPQAGLVPGAHPVCPNASNEYATPPTARHRPQLSPVASRNTAVVQEPEELRGRNGDHSQPTAQEGWQPGKGRHHVGIKGRD